MSTKKNPRSFTIGVFAGNVMVICLIVVAVALTTKFVTILFP